MKPIIYILFFRCNRENITSFNTKDYEVFSIKSEQLSDLKVRDSVKLEILKREDSLIYNYKLLEADSLSYFVFSKAVHNDLAINNDEEICQLIDTVSFVFNRKKVKVFKYSFDLLDWADEEMNYYYSIEYGMILCKSLAWSSITFFNEEELGPLHDSIINSYKFKTSNPPATMVEPKN